MDVLHKRCAGLDVHKDSVVACVRLADGAEVIRDVRTFATTTSALLDLSAWLAEHGCTHVAMEATGVYWKPVWYILADGEIELILANAAHVKGVPGRKTDVNDATWLADLLAHGLVRSSFVPPVAIAEIRELARTRKQLTREKTRHTQRIQKALEAANIKLDSVISEILGITGRAILDALVAGETDPAVLAAKADRRIKASPEELRAALFGRVTRNHRFLLKLHLQHIDAIDQAIAEIDAEVAERLAPFRQAARLLTSIPGVGDLSAETIISEIGVEMDRFPTAGHLVSWAGLSPRNDESAGKRRSNRLRPGAPWLKTTLVQCAVSASKAKGTYLRALYHRLRARRGPKKAICALAASMLTLIYHMLKDGTFYTDLGPDHFDRLDKKHQTSRLVRRLKELGYAVQIEPIPATS
jgi:transposase